ncbi:MAG: hypothetical protein COA79_21065 [Planctomycetota bacterium]|nr:MAG: hypothetical protein COA79_21065 [Planctomycetota bacterium]
MFPNKEEFLYVTRSLIMASIIFTILCLASFTFVNVNNSEACKFRIHGGRVDTNKLNKYDREKEIAFISSLATSIILSQFALYRRENRD